MIQNTKEVVLGFRPRWSFIFILLLSWLTLKSVEFLNVCFFYPLREAVSNFLTALSLQRKSRNQQQVPHPAISGNIWAALRIALSLMDQPELFQAANLGDLDVLLRAFNLDPWRKRGKKSFIYVIVLRNAKLFYYEFQKKDKNGCSKGHGDITQGNSHNAQFLFKYKKHKTLQRVKFGLERTERHKTKPR